MKNIISKNSDLVISTFASLVLFAGMAYGVNSSAPDPDDRVKQVYFDVRETKPEPEPEEPAQKAQPQEAEAPEVDAPDIPIPSSVPDQRVASAEPPRAVFGASANSFAEGPGDGFAMRAGNTIDREQEKEFTDPRNLKPYFPKALFDITEMPRARDIAKPKYPPQARMENREGTVMLEVEIDEDGNVRKVRVVTPAGFGFDEAAVEALAASSYHPAMMGDRPAAVKIKVPVRFVLAN